jgi:hypothetical protein
LKFIWKSKFLKYSWNLWIPVEPPYIFV